MESEPVITIIIILIYHKIIPSPNKNKINAGSSIAKSQNEPLNIHVTNELNIPCTTILIVPKYHKIIPSTNTCWFF